MMPLLIMCLQASCQLLPGALQYYWTPSSVACVQCSIVLGSGVLKQEAGVTHLLAISAVSADNQLCGASGGGSGSSD